MLDVDARRSFYCIAAVGRFLTRTKSADKAEIEILEPNGRKSLLQVLAL